MEQEDGQLIVESGMVLRSEMFTVDVHNVVFSRQITGNHIEPSQRATYILSHLN